MEGLGTCRYGGVGYLVNSLKVAPRLLETMVSDASSEEVYAGVKPVCRGENYRASTSEENHWDTCSIGEGNCGAGGP